jgi:hypothetical protein
MNFAKYSQYLYSSNANRVSVGEDDPQTPLELFKDGSFKFDSSPKSALDDKPLNNEPTHKDNFYIDAMDPISEKKEEEPIQSAKKSTAVESSARQHLEEPQMYDHEDSPESEKIVAPIMDYDENRTQEFKIQENTELEMKSENDELEAQIKPMEVDKQESRYIIFIFPPFSFNHQYHI